MRMSDQTIESLQIEINASSQSASTGIDALTASLEKLEQATRNQSGLTKLAKSLSSFGSITSSITNLAVSTISSLADSLAKFQSIGEINIPSNLASQISAIGRAANDVSSDSILNVNTLGSAIRSLEGLGDIKISSSIATGIAGISEAVKSIDIFELDNIRKLAEAISSLASISDIRISSNLATQMINIGTAAELLTGLDLSVFGNLAEALHPLSEIGDVSNLGATLRQLKKLPEIATSISGMDLGTFATQIQQITDALAPLATQITEIASGFSSFPRSIEQVSNSTSSIVENNNRMATSYTELYSALRLAIGSVKAIASTIANWLKLSNDYVEDINLFTASLGEYAESAQAYAEKVGEIVGIDPGEWMKAQGVFYNLADGFGIAADRAYIMSQQLTQLSYDLASFYNIDVDSARLKLRGALSGEIEMMRQLGVDLSNAAMQEKATAMGIQTKVTAMTQAQKAQLRYLIIMERTNTAQHDMARTLNTPANQIRVLTAQLTQCGRALGNIFIPLLNAVLPPLIAVAKAVRILATEIASLFGYQLPEVDYSSLSSAAGSADDLTDSLDDSGKSAKKLKSYLMGFDELNVIDPSSSSGSGSAADAASALDDFDFELPTYDFLEGAVSSRVDAIMEKIQPVVDWITEHLEGILSVVKAIGVAWLEWKVAKALIPNLGTIKADLSNIMSVALSVATITITAKLVYDFANSFLETGNVGDILAQGLTAAAGAYISGKVMASKFGAAAGQFTAGLTLAITATVTLAAVFDHVEKSGFDREALIEEVWAIIAGAGAGALIAKAAGAAVVAGAAVGGIITLTVGVIVAVAAYEMHQNYLKKLILWGEIALTAAEIEAVATRLFSIDVDATVDLVNAQLTNEETAQKDLNKKILTFSAGINKVMITAALDENTANDLLTQLTGEGGIIPTLQTLLQEQESTVTLGVKLVSPVDSEGNDLSADLLSATGLSTSLISETGADIGNKLSMAIQNGMVSGFANGEDIMIAEMTDWLNRLTSATQSSGVIAGFQYDTAELLANVTRDSFSGVLDAYAEKEGELRESLEAINRQMYVDTQTKQAQLQVTLEYWQEQGDAEMIAQTQQALDDVNYILANWDAESSIDAAMANTTEVGREAVIKAYHEIFDETLTSNAVNSRALTDLINSGLMGNFEGTTPEELVDGARSYVQNILKQSLNDEDWEVAMSVKDKLSLTDWDLFAADAQTQIFAAFQEAYGSETAWAVFEQLGYDMTNVVAQGITAGTVSISGATDTLLTVYSETFGTKTLEITPALLETFKNLGIDLSTYMQTGLTEGTTDTLTTVSESGSTMGTTYGRAAIDSAVETVSDGSSSVASALSGVSDNAGTVSSDVADTMTSTAEAINLESTEAFDGMSAAAGETFENVNIGISTTLGELVVWIQDNVTTPICDLFSQLSSDIVDDWNAVDWNNVGVTAGKGIAKGFKSVRMPKVGVDWSYARTSGSINGRSYSVSIPKPNVYLYAKGGLPDTGELFMAREAGPELVGNIGSKSAVVNNDQIVEAVAAGVYEAVVAAMNNSSDEREINVTLNLDGEKVYQNQQKVARRHGYDLGTRGVW